MKSKNNSLRHLGFIALAFAGLAATTAQAATWTGSVTDDGLFSTTANWSDNLSPAGKALVFAPLVNGTDTTLSNDLVGGTYTSFTYNASSPAFVISGSSFTLSGGITNSSGSLQTINNNITLSTATHTFSAASGNIALGGNLSGSTGNVTFTGSGTTTLGGTNTFTLNNSGHFGAFLVGSGNGTSPTAGNVSITGATEVTASSGTSSGFVAIVGNSTLTIQSGGSLAINGVNNNAANTFIGQNGAGTSTLRVNGGSLAVSGAQGFVLGNNRSDATGVLQISSGTATITAGSTNRADARSSIRLGLSGGNGRIDLDGGTLETSRYFLRGGAGTANFNFNGGTLKALTDQTAGTGWFETATTITTTVKVGGAKIDTNGFNTNINTVLEHDSGLGGMADGGLTKSGSGTLTLGAANTYSGATTIKAGILKLDSAGTIANSPTIVVGDTGSTGAILDLTAKSAFSVVSGQKVTGIGDINIGSANTITIASGATLAPSVQASGSKLDVDGKLDFVSGSIFEWDLNATNGSDPGVVSNSGNYGQLAATGAATGTAVFDIVLGSNSYADAFWNTNKSWTNIVSASGLADLTTLFTTFSGDGLTATGSGVTAIATADGQGYFGFSGTSLNWTAVPEPSSAMAGLLLTAGLLRRRRKN
jgi:fibronectin-binding autotransporter adhesin